MKSGWVIRNFDREIAARLSDDLGISRFIAGILCSRGISKPHEAYLFLNPRLSMLHSPFLFPGMESAVSRIRTALEKDETVGIFSDSDLDGLTSLALITTLLYRISPGMNIHSRYPRDGEQYGMTREIVDEFSSRGVSLILTLDSGIRDVDEIAHAAELGIDTIVCDHHEPDTSLPVAQIINPKLRDCSYPFRDLAGVGVAFKLSHALLMSYLPSYSKTFMVITTDADSFRCTFIRNGVVSPTEYVSSIEKMHTLAEKADFFVYNLEPQSISSLESLLSSRKSYNLKGEEFHSKQTEETGVARNVNNAIYDYIEVSYGRKVDQAAFRFIDFQYENTPKIKAFNTSILSLVALGSIADIVPLKGENRILVYHGIESLKNTDHKGLAKLIENRQVNAKTIGWHVAPILNAPGRMGKTDFTAEFLLQNGTGDPDQLMADIIGLNELRKNIVNEYCSKIFTDMAAGEIESAKPVIFLELDAPEGVAGLIANRITDALNKPVIVIISLGKSDMVKGSGRVRGGFDFFRSLEPISHMFDKIGGHSHAFGFTLRADRVEQVKLEIEEIVKNSIIGEAIIEIDFELPINSITPELIDSLTVLEPYGHENPEPLFISRDVTISQFRRFGTDNRHGKYLFSENTKVEAIGWGIADDMEKHIREERVSVLYRLEKSFYNGRITPRMIIQDVSSLIINSF